MFELVHEETVLLARSVFERSGLNQGLGLEIYF
jgi:hypothetical protein